jgi:hypothetical protein
MTRIKIHKEKDRDRTKKAGDDKTRRLKSEEIETNLKLL